MFNRTSNASMSNNPFLAFLATHSVDDFAFYCFT